MIMDNTTHWQNKFEPYTCYISNMYNWEYVCDPDLTWTSQKTVNAIFLLWGVYRQYCEEVDRDKVKAYCI